jgi:hypothetical protein
MILALKLLSQFVLILGFIYILNSVQIVFGAESSRNHVLEPNIKNMSDTNYQKLNFVTVNFLAAIDEANQLYDSENFSPSDEVAVRLKLRNAFEEYFATLVPLETQEGFEVTEHSRTVIQESIDEFMESKFNLNLKNDVAQDLNDYSTVMTEALIRTATSV